MLSLLLLQRKFSVDSQLHLQQLEQFAIEPGGSEAPAPPPRIVSVWPRPGSPIPANTLRFYVEFDQPMRAAAVDRAVQLVDASGSPIEDALVPIPEGLWDARQRRLTVTLHPGEMYVVPRGVEHRPVCREEVRVVLFEPASTLNTGNVTSERTVQNPQRLI